MPTNAQSFRKPLVFVALFLALLWTIDDWSARHNPEGSVQVAVLYQMPLKSGKIEYDFDHYETRACVASELPHLGLPPCWYLQRHRTRIPCC